MLQKTKITNIKRLFSERKAITIAMFIILITDLLNQFQTIKSSKEKKTSYLKSFRMKNFSVHDNRKKV